MKDGAAASAPWLKQEGPSKMITGGMPGNDFLN